MLMIGLKMKEIEVKVKLGLKKINFKNEEIIEEI